MPSSVKANEDKSASTGELEVDAAQPVKFKPNDTAKPGKDKNSEGELTDAGELADAKHNHGKSDNAAPGAIAPDQLTTESDDAS